MGGWEWRSVLHQVYGVAVVVHWAWKSGHGNGNGNWNGGDLF
jgi:hypothetical protein